MRRIFSIFKKKSVLCRDQRGVAAVEFALALPVMVTLFFGMVEITRYVLIHQKTEKTAYSLSDLVAQSTSLTNAQLTSMFAATSEVMNPFATGGNSVVIITSIQRNGNNPPQIAWQRKGGGTLNRTSHFGTSGMATLPPGFTLQDKENVIFAEVFYQFTPMFGARFLGSNEIYKTAVFRPRLGALTTPPA